MRKFHANHRLTCAFSNVLDCNSIKFTAKTSYMLEVDIYRLYTHINIVHGPISDSHDCFQWEEKAFSVNGVYLLCTCRNRPCMRIQVIH